MTELNHSLTQLAKTLTTQMHCFNHFEQVLDAELEALKNLNLKNSEEIIQKKTELISKMAKLENLRHNLVKQVCLKLGITQRLEFFTITNLIEILKNKEKNKEIEKFLEIAENFKGSYLKLKESITTNKLAIEKSLKNFKYSMAFFHSVNQRKGYGKEKGYTAPSIQVKV